MNEYALTPIAQRDIRSIWLYIADDSPKHADLVRRAILTTCQFAADFPQAGHPRPEFSKRTTRVLAVTRYEKYSIVFLPETKPLKIVRILNGYQDFSRIRLR